MPETPPRSGGELLPDLYGELRSLAAAKLKREPAGQTLQATALVHEAWLRLDGSGDGGQWENRRHFFGAAAEAMRRILIDKARHKQCQKAGGEFQRTEFRESGLFMEAETDDEMLGVDEALAKLEEFDPQSAELVKLRYFAGFSLPEVAEAMEISVRTADRRWAYAKAWLYNDLSGKTNDV